jgi:hypothetical protein
LPTDVATRQGVGALKRRTTAMVIRAISAGVVAVAVAASAAMAAGLTERLQASRMTVLQVDKVAGRFMCVEHYRWTAVDRSNLGSVQPGDIVRVEQANGRPGRLVLLRTAADELTSPE